MTNKAIDDRLALALGLPPGQVIDRSYILGRATNLVSDALNTAVSKGASAEAVEATIGLYRLACDYLLRQFKGDEDANAATLAVASITISAMCAGSSDFSRLDRRFQSWAASARNAKASKHLDSATLNRIIAENRDAAAKTGGKAKIQIAERALEPTNTAIAIEREKRGLQRLDEPHFKSPDTLRRAHDRLQKRNG